MRAMCVDAPGPGVPIKACEVAEPVPADEEVNIRVACSSANWSDVQKRQGVYPAPVSYPLIPGLEVSGIVESVGTNVREFSIGQRVAAIAAPRNCGGFAEKCLARHDYVFAIPSSLSMEQAATFPVVCLTAWHLLNTAYRLKPGETVLIHAIGGGVGLVLTQIARAVGAIVIGTVGTAGKGERAKAFGARAVFDRNSGDFVEEVRSITNGVGVDLVIDSVGGDVLNKSFDVVKPFGRIINIGEASGYPQFDIREAVYRRSSSFSGFELLHAISASSRRGEAVKTLVDDLTANRLHLPIERVFELAQVTEMLDLLESRQVSGKLVVRVAPIH